ncbi:hypothetical protein Tco_1359827 [Tanacetum coccineum]
MKYGITRVMGDKQGFHLHLVFFYGWFERDIGARSLVPLKKTPRKTGIWSIRKTDSRKRNVVFSPETKVHYFDKDDMDFDDMGQTVEEVEHRNTYSENG